VLSWLPSFDVWENSCPHHPMSPFPLQAKRETLKIKTCRGLFHIDPQQVNRSHLVQWQDKTRWMALHGSLCRCDRIQLVSEKNYSNLHKATGFCRDMHRHSSVKMCKPSRPSSAVMCRDVPWQLQKKVRSFHVQCSTIFQHPQMTK
jgi:hypothetical protein